MVAESSTAEVMAALVAEKFDLRLDRDRELIRWLHHALYCRRPSDTPTLLWRMNGRVAKNCHYLNSNNPKNVMPSGEAF
jgi:hypothetical protein